MTTGQVAANARSHLPPHHGTGMVILSNPSIWGLDGTIRVGQVLRDCEVRVAGRGSRSGHAGIDALGHDALVD
jgi:hypothetical protein